jgi:hypothetical protein
MNREMRRKLKITKEQDEILSRLESGRLINAGSKVKLKYDQITSRKDWEKLNQKYKDFVETNKDKEFTVQIDEKVHNMYKLVSLEEDTMEPKFLFWVGDLLLIDT